MIGLIEERSRSTGKPIPRSEGNIAPDPDTASEVLDLRMESGILVLSTNAHLLHINHKGSGLLKQMKDASKNHDSGMPGVIAEVCVEIEKHRRATVDAKEWVEIEVKRTSGTAEQPVLVRGFCMPGEHTDKQARVLIILEPIGRRRKIADQGKERFQLTNREQNIVEHLAKGWTNKEIACALGIAEPTVKAHMKHIMEKTKCTTRTGVLAQLM